MEHTNLVIIGAGQAGLATANAAREAGSEAVVLEASGSPAGSWPTYYDSLRLFSPARYSALPGRPFPGDPERYPTRDEVAAYLVAYAEDLQADIRLDERVESVAVRDGAFAVQTGSGLQLSTDRVVSATGGFGSPHRPHLSGLDEFTGRVVHSSEYRAPGAFAGGRVLVVGAGNSAIQIAAELAEVARVTVASRHPIQWIKQRPLGKDLHWWLKVSGLDSAPIGSRLSNGKHPVLDDGGYRAAFASGKLDRREIFDRIDRDAVVWPDGARERVDAMVLATGFRPHVPFLANTAALGPAGEPLHRRGVSTTVPGLGYVGLEFQRSFASATIRGVGRDASYVLRRLRPAGAPARRPLADACCPAPAAP